MCVGVRPGGKGRVVLLPLVHGTGCALLMGFEKEEEEAVAVYEMIEPLLLETASHKVLFAVGF